ncbi:MAG: transcription elongation factor GreA [Patescibacteria group bacterium]|nr:transcription elongation factor GreA [Patescibacteria group bacterium]
MNTTISGKTIYLSKKGMKELKKAITQLEHDRKRAMQSIRELDRTTGRDEQLDRMENLSNLESIESELDEKKNTLSKAKLLPTKRTRLQVAIGSVVDLIDNRGRLFRFKIVDSIEANPSDGRISTLSPIGQSLIGKTVKDTVQWNNGSKTNCFKLVRIL